MKKPWPHLNIMHAAELFSLESPLYVWWDCGWLDRARPFKRMWTQTISWITSKQLTHLFYSVGPQIRQPSIFREWESVQHGKLIKPRIACFLQNSLRLHHPLARCSGGIGAVVGSCTQISSCSSTLRLRSGAEPRTPNAGLPFAHQQTVRGSRWQGVSHSHRVLGPWMQQPITPFCHPVRWHGREQYDGAISL